MKPRTCAVCGVRIEAVAEIDADSADGRMRFYHLQCYDLVVVERELLGRARDRIKQGAVVGGPGA